MGRLPDLLIILVVFLIFFGWKNAPEVGASLGRAIREFKKNLKDTEDEIKKPIESSTDASTTVSTTSTTQQ